MTSLGYSVDRDITPNGKRILYVAFYNAQGCGRCCQRFRHVELRFSDGTVTSITKNPGVVHYDSSKIMRNDNYSCFFKVFLDPQLEDWMQQKARWYYDQQTLFARWGVFWNFICCCWPLRGDQTLFCSQYITILLQIADMVPQLDPDCTSPTQLYTELKMCENVMMGSNKRKERGNLVLHY